MILEILLMHLTDWKVQRDSQNLTSPWLTAVFRRSLDKEAETKRKLQEDDRNEGIMSSLA